MSDKCKQCGALMPERTGDLCPFCRIEALKKSLLACMNLVPPHLCITFSGDVAGYLATYIGKLLTDIGELNDRMIERTKSYEEKDARQVREINRLNLLVDTRTAYNDTLRGELNRLRGQLQKAEPPVQESGT